MQKQMHTAIKTATIILRGIHCLHAYLSRTFLRLTLLVSLWMVGNRFPRNDILLRLFLSRRFCCRRLDWELKALLSIISLLQFYSKYEPPFGPSSLSPSSPSTVTESPYLPDSYIAQHPDSYTSSLRPENSSIRVIFLEAFSCSIKQHLLPYWNETKVAIQLWKYVAKPLKSQWTTILTATIALWFANPVAFANNSISRKHREY